MDETVNNQQQLVKLTEKNKDLLFSVAPIIDNIPQVTEELNNRLNKIKLLLMVDPGIAAQKLFNTGMSELKSKIKLWGLKEISEIAVQKGLPKISNDEELLNYKTRDLIKLSGVLGITNLANTSRLDIAYDMRNLIEHEDSHYEATNEEVQFIFKVITESILTVEVIEPVSIVEIQELIDSAEQLTKIDEYLIEKFESSAAFRQLQVLERIISVALDSNKPDIVRTNAYNLLLVFRNYVKTETRMGLVEKFITAPSKRKEFNILTAKVYSAIGILPYVSKSNLRKLFESLIEKMEATNPHWDRGFEHVKVLSIFEDINYFSVCPEDLLFRALLWMCTLYVGTLGGYGTYGRNRSVFYSDSGARYVKKILFNSKARFVNHVTDLKKNPNIISRLKTNDIKDRFNEFVELIVL